MADFPRQVTKVTTHNPPRYMFYMPGFNAGNGCWLHGSWVTISKERYDKEQEAHQKRFGSLREWAKNQSHHNKGIPISKLTDIQRQAWEHFSGTDHFDCYRKDSGKYKHCIGVEMAGEGISEKSLKWMRKEGYQVIPKVTAYKRVTDQLKGIKGLPEDLIAEEKEVVDTVAATIEQNVSRWDEMAEHCLKTGDTMGMGTHRIIELEEEIIRSEWHKAIGQEDMYENVKDSIEEYKHFRELAVKHLGEEGFKQRYDSSKKSHNECAKHNLGDHGTLYCFVLPKFNADGTHEPWGEHDVPWGTVKNKT